MTRPVPPKLITSDTLKAVDREYRDLVMSLRALAALLHDVGAPAPSEPPAPGEEADSAVPPLNEWEPVLANILDAELNQLAVLMGDVTVALKMENDEAGPKRTVGLGKVLESAVKRSGGRVLIGVAEPVQVAAHPDIVSQSVLSAVSLALRIEEGRVVATSRRFGDEGVVTITIAKIERHAFSRWESRLALLRKIVAAEGGRVTIEHRDPVTAIRLSFKSAKSKEDGNELRLA
ncbi:MAG: hypothetical protein NVSMB57_13910 [Actinomycetota bacterium]